MKQLAEDVGEMVAYLAIFAFITLVVGRAIFLLSESFGGFDWTAFLVGVVATSALALVAGVLWYLRHRRNNTCLPRGDVPDQCPATIKVNNTYLRCERDAGHDVGVDPHITGRSWYRWRSDRTEATEQPEL